MKRIAVLVAMGLLVFGVTTRGHASDWDKAGKILTGIEGVRVVTGGRVDIVGSMFGINREDDCDHDHHQRRWQRRHHHKTDYYEACEEPIWVPHYEWRRKYVSRHTEYRPGKGRIVVDGHYIKYKVEVGGHWAGGDCF